METQKVFDFKYDDNKYNITNNKNFAGNGDITFNQLYDKPIHFASLSEFWSNAKLGVHELRYIIENEAFELE